MAGFMCARPSRGVWRFGPEMSVYWILLSTEILTPQLPQQCNPQLERDILLLARRQNSIWAPHLLCAFQTATHLNLVMDYAEGGTLWDVLESSPFDGRIPEEDLHWWLPQVVSALAWCHAQGYVHRYVYQNNRFSAHISSLCLQ